MQSLKIALIGGTGKAGQYILQNLLTRQYPVRALVRNPEKITFKHTLLDIVPGKVEDYETVKTLLKDCQVVISALGMGTPASTTDIFTRSTSHILQAMAHHGLQRYIVITGLNVNTDKDEKGVNTQGATNWMHANYPLTTANKQTEYEMLQESPVQWTMVRLPLIEQTDVVGAIDTSLTDCRGSHIHASNLALFITEQLVDKRFIREAPFIWNI